MSIFTHMRYSKWITYCVAGAFLLLVACTDQEKQEENLTVGEKIARAHGFDQFGSINKLSYRFNVQRDTLVFGRDWQWWPKTGDVIYSRGSETVSFNQFQVDNEETKMIDQRFINDKYWLLFPFQLVWDADVSYVQKEDAEAPISGERMHHVVVSYSANGGYTPGDVYELFCDESWVIREWIFRRGGDPEPTIACTWENYVEFNGVKIATEHRNADESFRLFFTGLSIE